VALRGIVSSISLTDGSFTFANGVSVSYSGDKVVPKGAQIRVGADVRVLSDSVPANGKLVATKVLVLNAAELTSGSSTFASGSIVKIKGIVDSVSGTSMVVSGTKVDLGNLTAPAIGAVVEVKGSLSAAGTIVASQIELEGMAVVLTCWESMVRLFTLATISRNCTALSEIMSHFPALLCKACRWMRVKPVLSTASAVWRTIVMSR
jgi:hypothetical protein